MRFAHPELLWLLAAVPLVAIWIAARRRAGQRALTHALGSEMAQRLTAAASPGARRLRDALLLVALACLVLGAARPQRGTRYVTAARTGGDVVIALDVSASMLAEDLQPNRLQRAKHEIAALLDGLRGDRVGLVAFAGTAFIQCPLTLDYGAARLFLRFMGPELLPEPGTDLAAALRVSARAFDEESEGYRALVLITDGEDHAGEVAQAAQEAQRAGIRVYAVGIGSESGEPIPERDETGEITGYKRDADDKIVLTRLEPATLRTIAETTGGFYISAGHTLGLERVRDAIARMEKRELEGGIRVLYEDRYAYFVWPALLLLAAERWIPLRRRGRRARDARAGGTLALLVLLVSLPLGRTMAQAPPASGAATRATGGAPGVPSPGSAAAAATPSDGAPILASPAWMAQFEENEVFRAAHPADPRPLYNLGNLYYERDDWMPAEEHYRAAIHRWESAPAAAHYNLANTLVRAGRLEEARRAFLEALRREPEFVAAKENLELTQRLLDQQAASDSSQAGGQSAADGERGEEGQDQQGQQDQRDQQDQQDRQGQQDQQNQQGQQDEQEQQGQEDRSGSRDPEEREEQSPDEAQQGEPQSTGQDGEQDGEREEGAEAAASEQAPADSSGTLNEQQLLQILRGLEGQEQELLRRRFQSRGRRVDVEKDW